MRCQSCGETFNGCSPTCPKCGGPTRPPQTQSCPSCGAIMIGGNCPNPNCPSKKGKKT